MSSTGIAVAGLVLDAATLVVMVIFVLTWTRSGMPRTDHYVAYSRGRGPQSEEAVCSCGHTMVVNLQSGDSVGFAFSRHLTALGKLS